MMEENKYYAKTVLNTRYAHEIAELKKHQKIELVNQLADNLTDKQWVSIQFKSQIKKPFPGEDPLAPVELISSLEVRPVVEAPVEIKVLTPKYSHKKYTGFWQKLKLAFSKKTVYTEE